MDPTGGKGALVGAVWTAVVEKVMIVLTGAEVIVCATVDAKDPLMWDRVGVGAKEDAARTFNIDIGITAAKPRIPMLRRIAVESPTLFETTSYMR